jgi:hypothetical protein
VQGAGYRVLGAGCWVLGAISLSETSPFERGSGDLLEDSTDFGKKQLFLQGLIINN